MSLKPESRPSGLRDALTALGFSDDSRVVVAPMEHGYLNRSWLVRDASRELVVKKLIGTSRDQARRTQQLLLWLHSSGAYVPSPVRVGDDFLYGAPAGEHFIATTYTAGPHPSKRCLTVRQAEQLGAQLAQLHRKLWSLPKLGVSAERLGGSARSREPIELLRISKVARNEQLADALARNSRRVRPRVSPESSFVGGTHGDMQPYNLILQPRDRHFVFLDFDRVRRQPIYRELFRTVQMVLFSPERSALTIERVEAFFAAYSSSSSSSEFAGQSLSEFLPLFLADIASDCWQVRTWITNQGADDQSLKFFYERQAFLDWAFSHIDELGQAVTKR